MSKRFTLITLALSTVGGLPRRRSSSPGGVTPDADRVDARRARSPRAATGAPAGSLGAPPAGEFRGRRRADQRGRRQHRRGLEGERARRRGRCSGAPTIRSTAARSRRAAPGRRAAASSSIATATSSRTTTSSRAPSGSPSRWPTAGRFAARWSAPIRRSTSRCCEIPSAPDLPEAPLGNSDELRVGRVGLRDRQPARLRALGDGRRRQLHRPQAVRRRAWTTTSRPTPRSISATAADR